MPKGSAAMVAVVQLVEHQVVILAVAGSSPVSHPDIGNAVCASRRRFWFQTPWFRSFRSGSEAAHHPVGTLLCMSFGRHRGGWGYQPLG